MIRSPNESKIPPVDQWVELWSAEGHPPSLEGFVGTHPGLSTRELLDIVLVDQQMRWQDRCGPEVEDYLKRFPDIAANASMTLDMIFGEFRAAERLGIPVDVDTMVLRFPAFGDEIAKQAEFSSWIESESPKNATDHSIHIHDLRAGATFGAYELLERIGSGGMGSIFRARHRVVHRIVALKVLNAERMASENDRQRFRNESATVARLDHPNIVPVFEVGEIDQTPYFTTKLISPGSLEQNAHRVSGDSDRIADTLRQIALAVHYAHQHGVLHRDLKPSNVLIDERDVPFVTDFGLARILGDARRLTVSGDLIGTPVWMPPEFADPHGCDATIASDVYGLGAILYFLLTGRPPYVGRTLMETLSAIREHDPPAPRSINHQAPVDLDLICRRALDRVPARRYESAGLLADDLNRYLQGDSIHARPLPWWEVQRRRIVRRPVRSTAAMACLLLLVAIGVYTLRLQRLNSQLATLVNQASIARRDATASKINASLAENEAGRLRDEARAIQRLATRAQEDHQQQLYVACMRLAWEAWRNGDLRQASALLSNYAAKELRPGTIGFEWSYLQRHVNPQSIDFSLTLGEARTICLSADRQMLAIGTNTGTIEIFNFSTKERIRQIALPSVEIKKILFNAESTQLAALALDGTLTVVDSVSGVPVWMINSENNACRSFVFAANGQSIIAAHADNTLREWSINGDESRNIPLSHGLVEAMAMSQDGNRLAIAADVKIEIRDAKTLEVLITHGHESPNPKIKDIALSGDGTRCAIGRSDGWSFLLEFNDDGVREVLARNTLDYPRAVDVSFDGRRMAVCDYGGSVSVWHDPDHQHSEWTGTQAGDLILRASAHVGRGYDIAFDDALGGIISAGQDGMARVWSVKINSDPTITKLPHSIAKGSAPAILPDGSIIVVGKEGMSHLERSSNTNSSLGSELPHDYVAVSSNGTFLVCSEKDRGMIEARRVLSSGMLGDVVWTHSGMPIDQLIFSPDDSKLAIVSWTDDVVVILNAQTGVEVTRLSARQCFAAAWSPDGSQIAFTVMDDVHVADTQRWATHQILRGHSSTVTMLSWSPDGSEIASSSRDRSLCLWDITNGTMLHRLLGHRHWVLWSTFSHDGKTLVSADQDGIVKIWHVPTGQLIGNLWNDATRPIHSIEFTQDGKALVGLNRAGAVISFDTSQ